MTDKKTIEQFKAWQKRKSSDMRKNDFDFFQNKDCRYFPCHGTNNDNGASIPRNEFNCLFCYCPLMFIPECGGRYTLMENGMKDCMQCTRNHDKDAWKFVVSRLRKHMSVKVKFGDL